MYKVLITLFDFQEKGYPICTNKFTQIHINQPSLERRVIFINWIQYIQIHIASFLFVDSQ